MDKKTELEKIREEIIGNKTLPLMPANLVFGEGNPDCQVMFIGEAPGFHEDKQGRPFVGRAGQLLNQLITEVGWKREDVYITNIVKRRPPENRDPFPEEIEAYKPYLAEQIKIINPKVIAPLGRFSMNYFLPLAKISQDQGKVFEISDPTSSAVANSGEAKHIIYPLYHPAAALRSTNVLNDLRTAFKRLPDIIAGKYQTFPTETKTPTIVITKKKPESSQSKLF